MLPTSENPPELADHTVVRIDPDGMIRRAAVKAREQVRAERAAAMVRDREQGDINVLCARLGISADPFGPHDLPWLREQVAMLAPLDTPVYVTRPVEDDTAPHPLVAYALASVLDLFNGIKGAVKGLTRFILVDLAWPFQFVIALWLLFGLAFVMGLVG